MINFIILYVLYLNICLNFNCNGKLINVEVKIKEDWEEKREFIYLKRVELKERFVLIMNVKRNNKIVDYLFKNTGSFYKIEVNPVNKVFIVKLSRRAKFSSQLKMRILIEIANNEIVKKFLKNLGKQIRLNNNFTKNTNCYETSILEEKLEDINKKELLKENIQNYKDKLLSSYWSEINLIGYKIELLEKQKVEYPKELKCSIIDIGNRISGIIDVNKRRCFNCRVTQTRNWYNLLKGHYLCEQCGVYKCKYGKFRSKELWFKTTKRYTQYRTCFICGITQTSQ
uniref:GATA-type domain-containing protein n=1 Tax=Meloidogyne enterolobii TaxID=390850 RepID=A0A6V7WDI7_MELEN|nr:unnamed protein product [Meloidogyne enterolobii]